MDWNNLISDPSLSDLPYKMELNEWGKIEMSPASNRHSMLQAAILIHLNQFLPHGKTFVECSIETTKNVKVADVVWGSAEFFAKHGDVTPLPAAPEIVVEVASPSNAIGELMQKKELYFEKGAQEVWICSEAGAMTFHAPEGEIDTSALCPQFPERVES